MRVILLLTLVFFVVACAPRPAVRPAPVAAAPAPAPAPAEAAQPAAAAAPPVDLDYVIKRAPRGRSLRGDPLHALVVKLTFQGDPSGRTELDLPDVWAGEKGLERDLDDLEVTSEGARIEAGSKPSRRLVTHPAGARVTIRYAVAESPEFELFSMKERDYHRVLVQPTYFHAIGHTLWVAPVGARDTRRSVRLRWDDFRRSVAIANTFGVGERDQRFTTTLDRLRDAVFVGGDFRLHEAKVRGKAVSIALRGKWKFSDQELVELVAKVTDAQRSFFRDDDFDHFLVTLIPIGPGCCRFGGAALTDSFAMFVESDRPIDTHMIRLLAHESFHTWAGKRIRRQPPGELQEWFTEGVSDYYADLLSFRAGLITFPVYVEWINKTLQEYHLSHARNVTNEAAAKAYWSNAEMSELPQQRGALLALLWNDRIRTQAKDKSIDDVMRDLATAAREKGTMLSTESIDAAVQVYLPGGVERDIAKFVDKGETIPVSAKALGPCVQLKPSSIGPFDLGFDPKATRDYGEVRGVVPGGAAHRAGLRDGMDLEGSSWTSDPTTPATLKVVDRGRRRTLEYLPQGKPIAVPRYRLDLQAYEADRARCEALVRGSAEAAP